MLESGIAVAAEVDAQDIGWDLQLDPQQLRDKIDNADAPIEDDHETFTATVLKWDPTC